MTKRLSILMEKEIVLEQMKYNLSRMKLKNR